MRPAVKAGQKQYINFGKDQIMERKMKIGWGCDYTGVAMKGELMAYMAEKGYENVDFGGYDASNRKDDYPGFGRRVGEAVASGEVDQGVLICGTGIGISLTANKVPGIRAAVCSEPYSAAMAKRHIIYNRQMQEIRERELSGRALVIRPPEALGISRTEKDPDELERVYRIGREVTTARLDEIKEFLK